MARCKEFTSSPGDRDLDWNSLRSGKDPELKGLSKKHGQDAASDPVPKL
jgi:hypothetical protein